MNTRRGSGSTTNELTFESISTLVNTACANIESQLTTKLITVVCGLKLMIGVLQTNNDILLTENKSIKEELTKINSNLTKVPLLPTLNDTTSSNVMVANARHYADAVKSVHQEEKIREERKKNIKITGLPKNTTTSEVENVQQLVNEVLKDDLGHVTDAKRISRPDKGDIVVVSLSSEDFRNSLLRKSHILKSSQRFSAVYLSPNWTREQELQQYKLRLEKRRLNDEAQTDDPTFSDWFVIRKGKPINLSKLTRHSRHPEHTD
jgi:hypothetical protein